MSTDQLSPNAPPCPKCFGYPIAEKVVSKGGVPVEIHCRCMMCGHKWIQYYGKVAKPESEAGE